jgi:endogenous inhibitor of DNA gyrase (YacG/DUF329 family)
MPKNELRTFRCPTCSALLLSTDEDFPFCSDRCRRIDLGKWASGDYKISSPILDPDVLESLPDLMNAPRRKQEDDDAYNS